jgi:hypothetical protein
MRLHFLEFYSTISCTFPGDLKYCWLRLMVCTFRKEGSGPMDDKSQGPGRHATIPANDNGPGEARRELEHNPIILVHILRR